MAACLVGATIAIVLQPNFIQWYGQTQRSVVKVSENRLTCLFNPLCAAEYNDKKTRSNDEGLFLRHGGTMRRSPDRTIGGNETNYERKKTGSNRQCW
ncbi:hypothetical protein TNCV_2398761 [Trichonephila clavipes]|uniref:Uncharacterized protein n=1 Tax=Trichonephila clavipes TaxID=2585209 RepID=A0A8X6T2E1_TRICX|nr:hypothetical protein TNCV_2398761 [Trichonephila clavipes]